jgi:hypothetical protein
VRVALVAALLGAGGAWAQDDEKAEAAKVPVQVDVVHVSNQGDTVEPPELERMKETFAKLGRPFSSFKRLSSNRVQVGKSTPASVSLPNGRTATLKLQELKEGTATVSLQVPGLINALTLKLGREGAVYQKAGEHEGGSLVLSLSPAK